MSKAQIDWLLPSTPESLLMLDDPVEGLRPKWLPPGVAGDVLQIDSLGRLGWGLAPPGDVKWPLRAPDGAAAAPSYSFASAPAAGMSLPDPTSVLLTNQYGSQAFLYSWDDEHKVAQFDVVTPEGYAAYLGASPPSPSIGTAFVGGYGIGQFEIWAESAWWALTQDGLLFPGLDNAYDLGDPTHRVRDLHLGRQILAPNGTAAAPSYSFANAPLAGLYVQPGSPPDTIGTIDLASPDGYRMRFFAVAFGTDFEADLLIEGPSGSNTYLGYIESTTLKEGYVGSSEGTFEIWCGNVHWTLEENGLLYPGNGDLFDLGTTTKQIRNLYLSGGIFVDGIPFTGGGGSVTWPLLAPDGTPAAPSYSFYSNPNIGMYTAGATVRFGSYGALCALIGADGGGVGFVGAPYFDVGGVGDVKLVRDGPGILAQRNGANPQAMRIYETMDGGGNGSWLELAGASTMSIITRKQGSGAARALRIGTEGIAPLTFVHNNVTTWITEYGLLYPGADNAYDIGMAALQIRDLYVGRAVKLGASGKILAPDGAPGGQPPYSFASTPNAGFYHAGSGAIGAVINGLPGVFFNYYEVGNLAMTSGGTLTWGSDVANAGVGRDLRLARDGPGILAQRDGVNPQTLRVYANASTYLAVMGTHVLNPVVTAPATPPAGYVATYAKTDKKMYAKDDAGVETSLGGATVTVDRLDLERARFPDGTANNLFPLPVERISTGTPAAGMPKIIELVYQFDAVGPEWLIWKSVVPGDYAGGAITLVVKWSMAAAPGAGTNIRIQAIMGCIVEDSTDVRTIITPAPTVSADLAIPTLGQQKETRLTLTGLTNIAAGRKYLIGVSLYAANTNNATVADRVLEAIRLEFAR